MVVFVPPTMSASNYGGIDFDIAFHQSSTSEDKPSNRRVFTRCHVEFLLNRISYLLIMDAINLRQESRCIGILEMYALETI